MNVTSGHTLPSMTDTPTPAGGQAPIPLMLNCQGLDVQQLTGQDGERVVALKLFAGGGFAMATIILDRAAAKALAADIERQAGPTLTPATLADLPRATR